MSSIPPITTLDEWNALLTQCGCCPMEPCLEPQLSCQSQNLRMCAFLGDVVEISDDSDSGSSPTYRTRFYRTFKNGASAQGSKTWRDSYGFAYQTMSADWDNFTVERYKNLLQPALNANPIGGAPCELETTCTATGSYSFQSNTRQLLASSDSDLNWGPSIVTQTVTATLSNFAGQLDPRWDPESSDPQPTLPEPCYPMWHYTTTDYEIDVDSDGIWTGSHVSNVDDYYVYDPDAGPGYSAYVPDGSDSDSAPDLESWFTSYNDYSEEVTCASLLEALAEVDPVWPTDNESDSDSAEDITGTACEALYFCGLNGDVGASSSSVFRYRWTIPLCHAGSYYRIDWDEVFFPKAYLDWLEAAEAYDPNTESTSESDRVPAGIEPFDPNANPPPTLPTLTPKSWEWTGEALGPCVDIDSNYSDSYDPIASDYYLRYNDTTRRSPWSLTVRPIAEGQIELRNVRVQCYRNPYGAVSQPVSMGVYLTTDVDQDGILDSREPVSS